MFFAMLICFETLSEITKILPSCLFISVTGLVSLWPKVAEGVANNKKKHVQKDPSLNLQKEVLTDAMRNSQERL